ncbi:MAG: hypothetical protein ACU0CA_07765 [Paracoccaceae bacterium]
MRRIVGLVEPALQRGNAETERQCREAGGDADGQRDKPELDLAGTVTAQALPAITGGAAEIVGQFSECGSAWFCHLASENPG